MTQYNDRPQASKWEKRLMHSRIESPRAARKHFARIDIFIQLVLAVTFGGISCAVWSHSFFVGKHDLFSYMLLAFCIFLLKSFIDSLKGLRKSFQLTDIEALWYMEHNPASRMDGFYARDWVSHFPYWAERIDPETGNVDPNRDPADKPWREVKAEIRAMIKAYAQERQTNPPPSL